MDIVKAIDKIRYDKYLTQLNVGSYKKKYVSDNDIAFKNYYNYMKIFQESMKNNKYGFIDIKDNHGEYDTRRSYTNNNGVEFFYLAYFGDKFEIMFNICINNKPVIFNKFKFTDFQKAALFLINENENYLNFIQNIFNIVKKKNYSDYDFLKKNFTLKKDYIQMADTKNIHTYHHFNPKKDSIYF